MDLITNWDDLLSTSPQADALTKPASGVALSRLGFHIDDAGFPIPFRSVSDSELNAWRSKHGSGTDPIVAGEVFPGNYGISDVELVVHGVSIVDFPVGGTSRGLLRIAKDSIYGSAYTGLGARFEEDTAILTPLTHGARLFRWQLADIERISVTRTHKLFKLRDEELRIIGRTPDEGAKGKRAGVSINEWLSGKDPDSVTDVSRSFLRFGADLHVSGDRENGAQPVDGSLLLGFAHFLTKAIERATGRAASAASTASGKDRSHTFNF